MISDRIAQVRVRVRTDIPDATEIRPVAERLVHAVLERCAAVLEERVPGRIVLIRHLPLHWRFDESMADEPAQVEDLAIAAADTIERLSLPPMMEPPDSDRAAVIFDDEAHLRASYLLALARGRVAWFHAVVDDRAAVDPLARLAEPEQHAMAQATLLRLAREGVLGEALAARPVVAVAMFTAALGWNAELRSSIQNKSAGALYPEDFDGRDGNEVAQLSEVKDDPGSGMGRGLHLIDELADIESHWPTLAPAARLLALRVHAALLLDINPDASAAVALANAVISSEQSAARIEAKQPGGSNAGELLDRKPDDGRALVKESSELTGADTLSENHGAELATRHGGLFFLLDRVQELDIAESLWKACLPEGTVLAVAVSALLGSVFASDPAPAVFGGIDAMIACPEVSPEQQVEVAAATCTSLALALTRRGLAEIPPVTVLLANHPAGRLLVTTAEDSPFAFFAWPAATPEMLDTGLRTLLEVWPHRGALAAAPALAALDTSGRLRSMRKASSWPVLLPKAPTASAAALLALVVGAPSLLFAARSGLVAPYTAEAFVARYLARSARIRISAETIDVIFKSTGVDLDVRRAGLDRDPGWIPWLRRAVRFIFEEQELTAGEQR